MWERKSTDPPAEPENTTPDNQVMLCRSGITLREPASLVQHRLRDYVPSPIARPPFSWFPLAQFMETERYCDR
jgi:hypothetical protein